MRRGKSMPRGGMLRQARFSATWDVYSTGVTYDCQTCGACCYGPEEYVSVLHVDLSRMTRPTRARYVRRVGDRLYLKMLHGHCAALRARQGHFSCRVYKERPTPCHTVKEGSRECLDARKRRGIITVSDDVG